MKKRGFAILYTVFTVFQLKAYAQDSTDMKIISPFDSLTITNVKAIGNIETGSMEISMDVRNDYHKLTDVHWILGGFEDLGLTDDKGIKYKIFTSTQMIGTANINKGFQRITGVQFGSKKMDWLTYVKDTVGTNQSKKLIIRLAKVNKAVSLIKELQMRCILTLGYIWAGDKFYQIKNVKVDWIKPKTPTKSAKTKS
jgi:hypothetical protein